MTQTKSKGSNKLRKAFEASLNPTPGDPDKRIAKALEAGLFSRAPDDEFRPVFVLFDPSGLRHWLRSLELQPKWWFDRQVGVQEDIGKRISAIKLARQELPTINNGIDALIGEPESLARDSYLQVIGELEQIFDGHQAVLERQLVFTKQETARVANDSTHTAKARRQEFMKHVGVPLLKHDPKLISYEGLGRMLRNAASKDSYWSRPVWFAVPKWVSGSGDIATLLRRGAHDLRSVTKSSKS